MVKPNEDLTASLASCPSAENGHVNERAVDHPQEIRQPRSLQDLLRYAIEAGQVNGPSDAAAQPEAESMRPLDGERREFLERALRSMTVDTAAELTRAINVLRQLPGDGEDIAGCLQAFDTILNFVDNMDSANDFYKLGGFEIVPECLETQHDEIRCRALEVVAECTQNNPFCQEQAVRMGFLKLLLDIVRDVRRRSSTECRTAAFYAVSNIVRAYAPGWEEFLKQNGLEAVAKALESDSARLRTKAAFFLSSKLSENKDTIALLRPLGFIELLINRLNCDRGQSREWMLETLTTMVQYDAESLREATLAVRNRNMNQWLDGIERDIMKDEEANQEQTCNISKLKQLILSDNSEIDNRSPT